jgi:peroxiredoxin
MRRKIHGVESGGIQYKLHFAKFILLIAAGIAYSQFAIAADKNTLAPDFSLPVLTNTSESVSLSSLKGKPVIVNFWASWCKPCRKEIPELIKIYDKYKDQGFNIVGINIDQEKHNADTFAKAFQISYTVAFDPQMEVINSYKATGMPSSFIVDKNGVIREIVYGFSDSKKELIETSITALLAE